MKNQLLLMVKPGYNAQEIIRSYNQNHASPISVKQEISRRVRIFLIEFDSNYSTVSEIQDILKGDERIEFVQPNHTNISQRNTVPNDLDYPAQWSLNTSATAHIYAPQAWDITNDAVTELGDTIVIAVVDGGSDLNHNDLLYHKNQHEIPNNGIDDDSNGYIDDYDGWNAYNHNGFIPADGHGTHVSGITGAITNNSNGIAGVVWGAKILPIAAQSSFENVVVEGYTYMLEQRLKYNETNGDSGAYIVASNSSFGVDNGKPADYPIWCALYDSLGKAGILNMGATSNMFVDVDQVGDIPTTCPSKYMIAVTNINQHTNLMGGYGEKHIDLGAPGTDIYSTIPNHNYGIKTGTSMATPHVSGVVGAMYSAMCLEQLNYSQNHPDSIALWVSEKLLESTEPTNNLQGKTVTGGRLNMYKAIQAANRNNCSTISYTVKMDSCGYCEGALSINVSGPYPPYHVVNEDSITIIQDSTYQMLCSKMYYFHIQDSTGYSYTDSVFLHGNDTISIFCERIPASDSATSDGSINITPSGGQPPYTYQWNTGDTSSSISDIIPGTYHVSVTDSFNCIQTKSISLYTVDVNEIQNHSLSIFPNPTNGRFSLKGLPQRSFIIRIYDLSGKKIFEFPSRGSIIDLKNDLDSGIYILRVGNSISKKLVVID